MLLEIEDMSLLYGRIQALHGISLAEMTQTIPHAFGVPAATAERMRAGPPA